MPKPKRTRYNVDEIEVSKSGRLIDVKRAGYSLTWRQAWKRRAEIREKRPSNKVRIIPVYPS